MGYRVYTGKKGNHKHGGCHKKKSTANKIVKALQAKGKHARVRPVKSCG